MLYKLLYLGNFILYGAELVLRNANTNIQSVLTFCIFALYACLIFTILKKNGKNISMCVDFIHIDSRNFVNQFSIYTYNLCTARQNPQSSSVLRCLNCDTKINLNSLNSCNF